MDVIGVAMVVGVVGPHMSQDPSTLRIPSVVVLARPLPSYCTSVCKGIDGLHDFVSFPGSVFFNLFPVAYDRRDPNFAKVTSRKLNSLYEKSMRLLMGPAEPNIETRKPPHLRTL